MSDTDHVLGLVDDLVRLLADSPATTIEVEADGFAVTVTRHAGAAAARASVERASVEQAESEPKTQKVHATTVGIFSGPKSWNTGDAVKRGEILGGIQTLGHISEVKSPADGRIREVLVTAGAPVEYGQALFVIAVE